MIEINKFEHATTAVNAIHITRVLLIFDVTANAEQIPRICSAMGLLANIGPNKTDFISFTLAIVQLSLTKFLE